MKSAANFLSLFFKLFVVCNSKNQFNSSHQLRNAVPTDSKPEFLSQFADWVKSWSECQYFTLGKKISHALITTLRETSSFIRDLLDEGYNYILTARFYSDSLEGHLVNINK